MDNKYFENALSNFVFDVAGGSAICHMADKGYSVKRIKENLKYPISLEKIQKTVWEHMLEQKVLLLDEPGTAALNNKVIYVEKRGKYGRQSFCGVTVPNKDYKNISWHETIYDKDVMLPFPVYIMEKCNKNGKNTAYVSCDFGVLKKKNFSKFEIIINTLDNRKRDYIEGLPWISKRVYHQLNCNMQEIICMLYESEQYSGCCYFMELEEKVIF